MITILSALVSLLSFRVRSRASLELELVALRHQVTVLHRQRPGQLRLFSADRLLWVWLYRVWPQVLDAMVLVKPATVVQWHRKGFRLYWRWRSRRLGRPRASTEIRDLVRRMSLANPLWGVPRIHGELLKLGIEISQATVGRYLPWRPKAPSPTWRSFLHNHLTDIAAIDMFVVATATFRLLYALIVLGHDRRRIIHFAVTQNPTQGWLACQMTEAFPWDTAPRYLLRDRDASYGSVFRDRIRAMGVKEVVTAPRSPWQNPYVERLIGSIRRECLDHIVIFNEHHLRDVLSKYFEYHHKARTHLSLNKDCLQPRDVQPPSAGKIIAFPEVGGLHHRYERRAA
ncbi:integrase core domain-containing protein [Methylocystis sp.]|uniref:integrase core domain-containing protein n=1 Tax=Methylocystis sp. TaxID=1911079 RepID=UPI0025D7A48B|nr:integrase core domain-containing protein [Methylocystis sp.]